jgi:protoporphyrinogen oxidase
MEAAMADNMETPAEDIAPESDANAIGTETEQIDDVLRDAGKAALAKERANARAADKRAKELEARLKEFEDRDKTEAQRLQEERDALKAERDQLAFEQMRREVAEEKGLTPAQARRLVGTTREELEADADDVIQTFPVKTAPKVIGDVGQGARMESGQRVYTTKELSDFAFYTKNKEDILLAQREGRIVD